ncbi:ribosomal protein L11 methyltransferase [Ventosimonas gracilis]|uniref:Ribosomal protein L11 methyltransferase n=1 Tax=Ventosimonas gracilis TaxID=1680762 RepID=A0A139SNK3_9GAMM|nr:50S ribosomal protein L11 methyltransferase [Ventosimonas gracilis]KXU36136.1 ribosomal protein L11 methyltransferase [Ventosimonas gracilis]
MPWLQLRVAVTPQQAARLEQALEGFGALSVTLMDAADQPIFEPELGTTPLWQQSELLALFEAEADQHSLREQLKQLDNSLKPQFEHLPDQDWQRHCMDSFKPLKIGKKLWIVPSWHQPPEPGALNLLLDPGLAFGTGSHPTTALCLQYLEAAVLAGRRVLDFGCGSGILALAALLLGAREVIGTDIDPQALAATKDNAQRNGLNDERLKLYLPEQLPTEKVDVLIANILAAPLQQLAGQFAQFLPSSGKIALSGILAEQAEAVLDAYSQDFEMAAPLEQDGWILLYGTRK